jgi:hypothetical protein
MKKKLVWLVVVVVSVMSFAAWRNLAPKYHLIAAMRIVYADSPPDHPKNFTLAVWHLRAIPEDSLVYGPVPGYLSAIEAQRDQPEDFESFTPEQHYAAAINICHRPTRRTDGSEPHHHDCLLRSPAEFSHVIRHLGAIPKYSPMYKDAARVLRLVAIQRDHPQDLEAAREADFRQCYTDAGEVLFREHGGGGCGTALEEQCDLFGIFRATNRVIAATPRQSVAMTKK